MHSKAENPRCTYETFRLPSRLERHPFWEFPDLFLDPHLKAGYPQAEVQFQFRKLFELLCQ